MISKCLAQRLQRYRLSRLCLSLHHSGLLEQSIANELDQATTASPGVESNGSNGIVAQEPDVPCNPYAIQKKEAVCGATSS